MSDIVIKAENISKTYQLGKIGTGSIRRDLQYTWNSLRRKKQSPYFKVPGSSHISSDNVLLALDDVSFDIRQGESWGIVGRNGAGKSTLLKILSRIVKPTYGSISGKGRVSSLLEVGTGFHSELSGRENIFLSGYMLGMKKREISGRLDEIIAFSGVEDFLETPVKRYSSGMYVRLAFAVAAHLEPDILLVDEVLAVGDTEFQKKCMGKMRDVADEKGRTILFVSHNMHAVTTLCDKAIWLDNGQVKAIDQAQKIVNDYLNTLQQHKWESKWDDLEKAPGNDIIKVSEVTVRPQLMEGRNKIDISTPLNINYKIYNYLPKLSLISEMLLFNASGECIFVLSHDPIVCSVGFIKGTCTIPGNFLNDGPYYISFCFFNEKRDELLYFQECLHFTVEDIVEKKDWYAKWWGYIRPSFPLIVNQHTT
jgi:lipopolysaccharide transport system ATP-binding protein